jgi:beta-1,2-mannobiose phosphorylase / 1,2-beta-oligomannan phosphorylase
VLFTRSALNPILTPSGVWWEAKGVLNPGAVAIGERIALVYRAAGADGISRLGLAWTRDGERIEERPPLPLYEGALDDPLCRLGVEDPRITRLDGDLYLTYCKVSVEDASEPPLSWEFAPFRLRSGVARSNALDSVREVSLLLPETNTKDSVLFPERIDGRYAALTRVYPSIQYVTSPDLVTWSARRSVLEPIPGTWEGERVGAGPPPLRTPWGWLLLYHGNEFLTMPGNQRLYRMGLAVLDSGDPARVLYRHTDPIFSPEEPYETEGPVGNVVFATGLVEREETLYLYYGAGDGVIGAATARREDVYALLEEALGSPEPS